MTIPWRCAAWAVALLAMGPAAALGAEGPAAPDPVVATVGSRTITRSQVQRRMETLPAQQKKEVLLDARPLLRQMVQEELLLQAAEAEKMEADPAVAARLDQARRGVLLNEIIGRKILAAAKVGDDEVQKFYDADQARFAGERVAASHIMLRTEAEAQQVLEDLRGGRDFAALARERSMDAASAPRGGDLGLVVRGTAPKAFEDAAFKLKAGEISPVVKTEYGFHVIQVREHITGPRPFAEVKDQIREHLLNERRDAALRAYLGGLEKTSPVQMFENRLK